VKMIKHPKKFSKFLAINTMKLLLTATTMNNKFIKMNYRKKVSHNLLKACKHLQDLMKVNKASKVMMIEYQTNQTIKNKKI
jgi:hypothetical protein